MASAFFMPPRAPRRNGVFLLFIFLFAFALAAERAAAATPLAMEECTTVGARKVRAGLGMEYLYKEYQALDLDNLNDGVPVQTPDYAHKFTLAQLDLGFGVGPDAELQFLGSGLAVMAPRSEGQEKTWKGGPADLLVGFKWRFLGLHLPAFEAVSEAVAGPPQPGGEAAAAAASKEPNAAFAFYARTKLPNASEKKLLGTNNTDFEFGFLGDYGTRSPFSLHAALGMNIVGDPRRANWQDDLVTYRLAVRLRDRKALGAPWLPATVDFGFQGFAGYYHRHDRKERVFLQLADAAKWWGGTFELVFTRQIFGDKADRFELFNMTEDFGVALRGARVL